MFRENYQKPSRRGWEEMEERPTVAMEINERTRCADRLLAEDYKIALRIGIDNFLHNTLTTTVFFSI
jgi:hypothetical protein